MRLFKVMLKIIRRAAAKQSMGNHHKRLLRRRRLQGCTVYAILASDPMAPVGFCSLNLVQKISPALILELNYGGKTYVVVARLAGAFCLLASVFVATRAAKAEETLLLTPFGYLDTSGEPRDQSAEHARRLAATELDIKDILQAKGVFHIVTAPQDAPACPTGETDCILKQARAAGAQLVLAGAVQKASTMELISLDGACSKPATARRAFFPTRLSWRHRRRLAARRRLFKPRNRGEPAGGPVKGAIYAAG